MGLQLGVSEGNVRDTVSSCRVLHKRKEGKKRERERMKKSCATVSSSG